MVDENLEAWCAPCNYAQGSQDARDTRKQPRDWQLQALDSVVKRIINDQVATVTAAPGAGKTIFAGLVFEALRDADVLDRMAILVPRKTLVEQWEQGLRRDRHLELKPNREIERAGQDGVVVTYQSLNDTSIDIHQRMADGTHGRRTLLVLDEVHHVGEKHKSESAAWARNVKKLAGEVDDEVFVRGVLNLSGTLWRSRRDERISTVRYIDLSSTAIRAQADHVVTAEELIAVGQLRPVDIYRLKARVEVKDWMTQTVIDADIADLDEKPARAAMDALSASGEYRAAFVSAVLDRLEAAHRALGGHYAKALIVAPSQKAAYGFRDEVDKQMQTRGLRPLAEIAVSDEGAEAAQTLKRFRDSTRVGVLCTVGMAGEGYDCPDIAVVGFAARTMTKLYIHQVIARAMRVTPVEQRTAIIPAAIVVPDITELVDHLIKYLTPYNPDVLTTAPNGSQCSDCGHARGSHDNGRGACLKCGCSQYDAGSGGGQPPLWNRVDVDVREVTDERVTVSDGGQVIGDYNTVDVSAFAKMLDMRNVPSVYAPRVMVAFDDYRESRPFDPVPDLEDLLEGEQKRRASIEECARNLQGEIRYLERWWEYNAKSECPVATFGWRVNESADISTGGRESATLEQLAAAFSFAESTVRELCARTGKKLPKRMNGAA